MKNGPDKMHRDLMEAADLNALPDEPKPGKSKKPKGLIINTYVFDQVELLDHVQQLTFWDACKAYQRGEKLPEMDQSVTIIFCIVAKDNASFDPEHKKTLAQIRSEAGRKGAAATWDKDRTS